MTRRTLPTDCPCPWVRHPDGNPWIYRPNPDCPHHGQTRRLQPTTVTPIRKAER